MNGRPGVRRGDDDGGVLQVGDEVTLEPAQEALPLVAGQRRALRALFTALHGGLRGARARLRQAVKVRGAGDEGVRRQSEQQQNHRRARPHEFQPPPAQLFAQTFYTLPLWKSRYSELSHLGLV